MTSGSSVDIVVALVTAITLYAGCGQSCQPVAPIFVVYFASFGICRACPIDFGVVRRQYRVTRGRTLV